MSDDPSGPLAVRQKAAARDRAALGDLGEFTKRVLVVAAVAALFLLLWSWRHVLFLAFASVLIACGLRGLAHPIVRWTPLNQGWGLAAATLIVLAVLAGIGYLFGAQIAGELDTLQERLPAAWGSLLQRLGESGPSGRFLLDQLRELQAQAPQNLWVRVGGFSMAFFNGLLEAFLVIVAAAFFAASPQSYRDGVVRLAPHAVRDDAREALDASGVALRKWLLGTLMSMLAIALMVWLGLALIGVPAPLGLALLAGIGQFVPVIGPIVAAAPGVLLGLSVDPATAGWAALIYFAASQLEANLIYPLIQQRAVSLPPVLTVFAVVAFGLLFGPLGVLLAVPVTVVTMVFLNKFYLQRTLGEDVPLPGQKA